ncbi:MAG: hypothetical protein JF588_03700 [Caulobacterales bacterium]|nr:hypothetical protein [Caulobacterales bacterium]
MARFLDLPPGSGTALSPPLFLTPPEQASLARAPRYPPRQGAVRLVSTAPGCPPAQGLPARGAGTDVTVRAYPVRNVGGRADHMYVTFDDGSNRFIARGGPSADGAGMLGGLRADNLTVTGRVDPADRSPDARGGGRLMFEGFLPGQSAVEAVQPAKDHAAGVNRGRNDYRRDSSSNSFAADVVESLFGCRVGDDRTWGGDTVLREDAPGLRQPDLQAFKDPRLF